MKYIVEASRRTVVGADVDVVVVGGGPSGIAAAVSAARRGARTLLLERYGFLGGAGTASGVTNFCGLFAMQGEQPFRVAGGITEEVTERLVHMGGALGAQPSMGGRTAVFPYDMHAFKRLADMLAIEAKVQVWFHSLLVAASVLDSRIHSVIAETVSGRSAVEGRIFIDATGDAHLAAYANVPCDKGDQSGLMQFPTMMFRLGGVDNGRAEKEGIPKLRDLMLEAEAEGAYQFPRLAAIVRPQPHHGEWRVNMTRISRHGGVIDGTIREDLSYAEIEGRRQVEMSAAFLKERVPGFENSYVVDTPAQVGIRETRRIMGEYQLTEDDVLGEARFPDVIGCNGWPVERHGSDREVLWKWIPGRGYHQIPFRSLIPLGIENLLVSGRCISATSLAQSSIRVSGPCFVTGQAAGVAAALCVMKNTVPASLDVNELQDELKQDGVFLGE